MKIRTHESTLDVEELRATLHYDPETGVITRKVAGSWKKHIGRSATHLGTAGYLRINVKSDLHGIAAPHGFLQHHFAGRGVQHVQQQPDMSGVPVDLNVRAQLAVFFGAK